MTKVVLNGSSDWIEGDKSPSISLTREGRKTTREFIIPTNGDYSILDTFMSECIPTYNPPGQWPVSGVKLYVESVDLEPFSAIQKNGESEPLFYAGTFPQYDEWTATVKYAPLPYTPKREEDPPGPQPLLYNLERNWVVGADAMTLPGSRLFYEGEVKPIGDESIASVLRINTTGHVFTKHHMRPTSIPWVKIKACNNHCNQSNFSSTHALFPNVDAQTLLFQGVQIGVRFTSNGEFENTTTFTFLERTAVYDGTKVTWNHLYDATDKVFKRVYRKPSSEGPLYETVSNSDIEAMFA